MISGGIISILVDHDISISTQPNDVSFSESLEIPSQLILDARIEETLLEGVVPSEKSPVDLLIELKVSADVTCYINALPVSITGLRITVRDEDLADDLGREIAGEKSTQKASQSRETIAIAPEFGDTISPGENGIIEDSNKDRLNFCLDPAIICPGEEIQDEQDVEFDNFIIESPQENHTRDNDTPINPGLGQPLAMDAGLVGESMYENGEDKADDRMCLRSSARARLSRQIESNTGPLLDRQNSRYQDVNIHDRLSTRTHCGTTSLVTPILKPTVIGPSTDDASEEIIGLAAHPVAFPIAPSQPKAKTTRSKTKAKPKGKQKASKPESQHEEIKRVKKYSLKTPAEVPIMKGPTPKRTSAPKTSAPRTSVSKASLKVSAPKASSTPKTTSVPVAKVPKKSISKLLVPKKPPVVRLPKRSTRQSQANFPELHPEPQERQNSPASLEVHGALSLGLDAQGILRQKVGATDRRVTRLSEALAYIDDIEQHDASFGELIQTSLIYQSPQVTTRQEILSSGALESTPEPPREEAYSPGNFIPEVMHIVSENNTKQSPHVGFQSESSPSSLDRISPIPLPLREASPAEYPFLEATITPSKILTGPVGLRRSPRLASRYSTREASVALTSGHAEAPRRVGKSIAIDVSDSEEHQYKGGSWDDDSPFRADEVPLFDDHRARKTPLVSFSAKGPRNQGISSPKKHPLQRIRKIQVEKPENCPLPIQKSMRINSIKRKREREDVLVMENNKRQQTSRLKKSKDKKTISREVSPVACRDEENPIVPRNHPAARNTARFGSQGSRVNENGSPCGRRDSLQEHIHYEAIARKVLTDTKPSVMNDEVNGDAFFNYYDDDEGLKAVDSDQGFLFNLPMTSPSSFKVWPLSSRPAKDAIKRYLPHPKATNLEYREIETKLDHNQDDKLADPFLKDGTEKDLSSFARRLQYRRQTPTRKKRKYSSSPILPKTEYTMVEDPEATLVNFEKENPIRGLTSSSDIASDSSDEVRDHVAHKVVVEAQEAQCDEWRMALKPHQKGILDVLHQVSAVGIPYFVS